MSRSCRVGAALLAALVLVSGCGSESGELATSDAAGPTLMPIDSILLEEADTLYIGNPHTPVVDPFDGPFHISDIFSLRVLRFGRGGNLMVTYGRPGEGPGEFGGGVEPAIILDDSTVVVQSSANRRANVFDRRTGEVRRVVRFPADVGVTPPLVIGDDVWMTGFEVERRTSLTRWRPATDEFESLGTTPRSRTTSRYGRWRPFVATRSSCWTGASTRARSSRPGS